MAGRSRFLGPFRKPVLAVWNRSHRLARRSAQVGSAILAGRVERCECCGRRTLTLLRREVVPDRLVELWGLTPRLAEALRRKESLDCLRCGAKLRARRLARSILARFSDSPARSIRDWAGSSRAAGLAIAEINLIEGLHEEIARLPGLVASDYQEPGGPDSVAPALPSEDLANLSYPDKSFDLVLTSETLEHVPDLSAALAEIFRVLKPGGLHLATIPALPTVESTHPRARLDSTGEVTHLIEPVRHPGGDVGYLAFHEFGRDAPEVFRRAGFEVEVDHGPLNEDDLTQVYACRKPRSIG